VLVNPYKGDEHLSHYFRVGVSWNDNGNERQSLKLPPSMPTEKNALLAGWDAAEAQRE